MVGSIDKALMTQITDIAKFITPIAGVLGGIIGLAGLINAGTGSAA